MYRLQIKVFPLLLQRVKFQKKFLKKVFERKTVAEVNENENYPDFPCCSSMSVYYKHFYFFKETLFCLNVLDFV